MAQVQSVLQYMAILFCLITMLSCSTTTVHVNTTYLNEVESKKIKNELEEKGFNVEFNEYLYPNDVLSTSILYSPFLTESSAVDNVEDTLSELGYDIKNINSLVVSNHWYTKNTMGLYIVPNEVVPNDGKNMKDIANQYKSLNCDTLIELNLKKNGKFLYSKQGEIAIFGKWSLTSYPYILLERSKPYLNVYFEIKKSKRTDQLGHIDITELHPINSPIVISQCTLTYGIRI